MADIKEIRELARQLGLYNIAAGMVELENETLSNSDYLLTVLKQEAEFREQNRCARLRKRSHLPRKTFDKGIIPKGLSWQLEQLEKPDWIADARNIFILGNCNTGKTSLATLLGEYAMRNGIKTFYVTLDDFLDILKMREKLPRANSWFNYMKSSDLIILDDFFYLIPSPEELHLLYRAITFLNEERSLIVISNRELSSWSKATEDPHLVQTMVDRIAAGCQIIRL